MKPINPFYEVLQESDHYGPCTYVSKHTSRKVAEKAASAFTDYYVNDEDYPINLPSKKELVSWRNEMVRMFTASPEVLNQIKNLDEIMEFN